MSKTMRVRNLQELDHLPRWALVETNLHQERKAKFHLERLRFTAYLPMRAVEKKRRSAETAAPFLPNYLFVQMAEAMNWSNVFGCIGVRSVISMNGKPRVTPLGLVESLMAREVYGLVQMVDAKAVLSDPKVGGAVLVTDGPFAQFNALFEERIDANRVRIVFSLFGRQTRAVVANDQWRSAY
ncbi:MAG: transcription termination/antitermination NusG family protein [Caulobacteraceae bacterium]